MILRPVDETGDILPVLSSGDPVSGAEAAAQLVRYRLSLLQGEWWETPEAGFFLLKTLAESRVTEADASALSSRITAYVRETPGVREVTDVRCTVSGRRMTWSCSVSTEEGSAQIRYESELH